MSENKARFIIWDYWKDDNYTFVIAEEYKDNEQPILKLMWKKNNDTN